MAKTMYTSNCGDFRIWWPPHHHMWTTETRTPVQVVDTEKLKARIEELEREVLKLKQEKSQQ